MTMSRPDRSTLRDRDDRADGRSAPGSLPIRVAELALRNPVITGGIAVSVLMFAVTATNAVVNQPQRHPRPLFETRSLAPLVAPAPLPATVAVPPAPAAVAPTAAPVPHAPASVPVVMPRPRPVTSYDEGLVRDLQTALAERGFYAGSVDGVVGPATAEAIRACERRLGTTPTGEPNELLLAALRAAPTLAAQPVAQPATKQAAAPARQPMPIPTPLPAPARQTAVQPSVQPAPAGPTPSMRVATAEAVAYPVQQEEAADWVEVDTPVFTGSIRRAAREPLAPGGDEKLQKLQRALIGAGYGPLKADGRWDERSISAVRRYEADRGWTVTGKPSDRLVWDLVAKASQTRR